ncbi:hypothetical protein BH23ACI1_BH23ACI1_05150 [soil metagenome]
MGSSGAMFFEPYDHDPANKGLLRPIMRPEGRDGAAMGMTAAQRYTDFPPGNLEKLVEEAIPTGLIPHIHAIGDKGNRIILDVYEKLLTRHDLVDRDHYGLYAAVARQTLSGEPPDGWFPDERLTIEEAIEAYTKAPA